ncbi:hypothetical protein M9H77_00858 [Catharanthus roseus]|uniref:Uncharacterized protein n=1 Tax=Catharanthus roseus TaxID=4058 RepID=A0ACC0C4B9_CATRO|nr:hypothetical protein M9H77_00858 [Catharanthus roseus]
MADRSLSLNREIPLLILQFLKDQGFSETVHELEQSTSAFLDFSYLAQLVIDGKLNDAESYLSAFTRLLDDQSISEKVLWNIKKQKFLEALDEHDQAKAIGILRNDLTFGQDEEEVKELKNLVELRNFRDCPNFANFDKKSTREDLVMELGSLILNDTLLQSKAHFPAMEDNRLMRLALQGYKWENNYPTQTRAQPTLGSGPPMAHTTAQVQPVWVDPSSSQIRAIVPVAGSGYMLGPPISYQGTVSENCNLLEIFYPSAGHHQESSSSSHNVPFLRPFTAYPGQPSSSSGYSSLLSLPSTLARSLKIVQMPCSMDFHPIQQTKLLVGTNKGRLLILDVNTKVVLFWKNFIMESERWDSLATLTRVLWNKEGNLFGVSSTNRLVRIYSYTDQSQPQELIKLEAHSGWVNDISFVELNNILFLVTCGDDKLVKIWGARTGLLFHTYSGFEAPICSISATLKYTIFALYQQLIVVSINGNLELCEYPFRNKEPKRQKVNLRICDGLCRAVSCTADNTRFFASWLNIKGGRGEILEMTENFNESKASFEGINDPTGYIPFEIIGNQFMAVGDEFSVKLYDINYNDIMINNPQQANKRREIQPLQTLKFDGKFNAAPRIKSNKDGSLIAVTTANNGIFIFASFEGLKKYNMLPESIS